jgi:hypothetical protein
MPEDYDLGVQLRHRIAQALAQGLEPDQRRVEALVGDLLSDRQHILASAIKHIAKAPAVINSINSDNFQSAELTIACLLKEIEVIYSPTVCTRTAEVARGILGLSPSHEGRIDSNYLNTLIHKEKPKPVSTSAVFTNAENSKTLLQDQRQSLIMFVGGSIVGLVIMAGIGAMIGLATLRNQSSKTATAPSTKSTTSAPTAQQRKGSSSDDQATIQSRTPATNVEQPQNRNEIDDIADEIFWRKYPQMYGKKLSSSDGALASEWSKIRRCDAVVDHAFYQLYPSMRGQTIDPNNSELVSTWNQIKSSISSCQ